MIKDWEYFEKLIGKKIDVKISNIGNNYSEGIYNSDFGNIRVIVFDTNINNDFYSGYINALAKKGNKIVFLVFPKKEEHYIQYYMGLLRFIDKTIRPYRAYVKKNKYILPISRFIDNEYTTINSNGFTYDVFSYIFGDICNTMLYYPFDSSHFGSNEVVGHSHEHDWENVLKALYFSPESFNINEDEFKYYSKQELEFIRLVKSYLLAIGLKDKNNTKTDIQRVKNTRAREFSKYDILFLKDYEFNSIISGKTNNYIRLANHQMVNEEKEKKVLLANKEQIKALSKRDYVSYDIASFDENLVNYKGLGFNSFKEYFDFLIEDWNKRFSYEGTKDYKPNKIVLIKMDVLEKFDFNINF